VKIWGKFMNFLKKIGLLFLLSLLLAFAPGYATTRAETTTYITIQKAQLQSLEAELTAQESELIALQKELQKLKKPSAQLQSELQQAKSLLQKSQTELQSAKDDLTALSNEMDALKTSLKKLNEQLNKERRVQRRQLWQNRFWALLVGVGIGIAAH
jgi:predicted  nucleic acid-binding Zn-ribbon protein